MELKSLIRDVPNYPKAGIVFKDITPLLQNPKALGHVVQVLAEQVRALNVQKICGIESRGFIFGAPLAVALGVGFVPIRKPGKLPWQKISQEYALEYGTDTLEMHRDAVNADERILIVDDVLATGGTAQAVCQLVEQMQARVVGLAFLMELSFLSGRDKLKSHEIISLIKY